ncbi:MAG: flagellar basal body P-ring protein FlgI [Nitrospiria bacterium]
MNQRKEMSRGVKFIVFSLVFYFLTLPAEGARIKDITSIEGVRENSLIGYGLIIGLNGTGDKSGTVFTLQTLTNMLNKMGILVDPTTVKVKNVAAVVVTAKLPPFNRPGSRIDVSVSSLGDATSLQGGTLLMTPLRGPDQEIYAVAQGPVSIGGFIGGKEGDTIQKNHPTAGRVPDGATVEKEVKLDLGEREELTLMLKQQDFTTAMKVSQVINAGLKDNFSSAVDSDTIYLKVPDSYKGRIVELLAAIESLDVPVDVTAKVVVNERTGTIVMGDQVRISDIGISHGNLIIRVKTDLQVSQPASFGPSNSKTVVVPKQKTTVTEEDARMTVMKGGATIGEVVNALNAIGVTPRDLIAILQAMKAAGALQAELEIL